jgi:hypothetical protein
VVLIDPAFTGSFVVNDVLQDDLGRTFRVETAYPTPAGWQIIATVPTMGAVGPAH